MNERIRELRKTLGLNQVDFSKQISVGSSTLAMFETGDRIPKDIHITQICSTFNVNEEWLRNGTGNMFVEPATFSLDDYAKSNHLNDMEVNLVRGFMELDPNTRNALCDLFRKAFAAEHDEIAATSEEDSIEKELNSYRLELEAEKKGIILPVTQKPKEGLG